MRQSLWVSSLLLIAAAAARGGVLTTTDGEVFEGRLRHDDDGWTVTQKDGKVQSIAPNRVKSIELGAGQTDPDRANSALLSLRRSVEFSDDLPRIVQRYQAFIVQSKDAATVAAAKDDLLVWQDRQDRGLVKLGRRWMTPADRLAAYRDLRDSAEAVRLFIKSGQTKKADQLVADGLDVDPANVSLLYLRGVLSLTRQDLNDARKWFTAVQQQLPQHAPTLVNLAIINLRQHQWGAACLAMDQALAAAPQTQVLLDTTAEFVRLVPAEQGRISAAKALAKRFLDQDAQLQRVMATRHLYRWGSAWIDQAAHDKIQAQADAQQAKIKQLQTDFDAAQTQIANIDKEVSDNNAALHTLEAHQYATAADGTRIRLPLPRAYYDLQNENQQLAADRQTQSTKLDTLRTQARDAQAALPQPTYTGVVNPIGEDGVPLPNLPEPVRAVSEPAAASSPTSAPTTEPSSVIRVGPG